MIKIKTLAVLIVLCVSMVTVVIAENNTSGNVAVTGMSTSTDTPVVTQTTVQPGNTTATIAGDNTTTNVTVEGTTISTDTPVVTKTVEQPVQTTVEQPVQTEQPSQTPKSPGISAVGTILVVSMLAIFLRRK